MQANHIFFDPISISGLNDCIRSYRSTQTFLLINLPRTKGLNSLMLSTTPTPLLIKLPRTKDLNSLMQANNIFFDPISVSGLNDCIRSYRSTQTFLLINPPRIEDLNSLMLSTTPTPLLINLPRTKDLNSLMQAYSSTYYTHDLNKHFKLVFLSHYHYCISLKRVFN